MKTDKRKQLEARPFSYTTTKNGKVLIYRDKALIMQMNGKKAMRLIEKLEGIYDLEEQLILAKVTGQYKYGNER